VLISGESGDPPDFTRTRVHSTQYMPKAADKKAEVYMVPYEALLAKSAKATSVQIATRIYMYQPAVRAVPQCTLRSRLIVESWASSKAILHLVICFVLFSGQGLRLALAMQLLPVIPLLCARNLKRIIALGVFLLT
jgi:hypothetical protein